jgi:hypothetical protein
MSGNDIINMVINYAKNNNFIILSLDDQSSIKVNVQGEEYNLDLTGLTILSSGISWYNKLGFKQKEYDIQLLHWKEIRKSTLNQLGDIILNLDSEKIKIRTTSILHLKYLDLMKKMTFRQIFI